MAVPTWLGREYGEGSAGLQRESLQQRQAQRTIRPSDKGGSDAEDFTLDMDRYPAGCVGLLLWLLLSAIVSAVAPRSIRSNERRTACKMDGRHSVRPGQR